MHRWPWLALMWTCLGLGGLGMFLPLLPTTPFLLVAAWAAPKASPRLRFWLYRHRHFGPPLRAWYREGAVSRGAKLSALLLMLGSWVLLWFLNAAPWLLGFTALLFAGLLSFLLSRPEPGRTRKE